MRAIPSLISRRRSRLSMSGGSTRKAKDCLSDKRRDLAQRHYPRYRSRKNTMSRWIDRGIRCSRQAVARCHAQRQACEAGAGLSAETNWSASSYDKGINLRRMFAIGCEVKRLVARGSVTSASRVYRAGHWRPLAKRNFAQNSTPCGTAGRVADHCGCLSEVAQRACSDATGSGCAESCASPNRASPQKSPPKSALGVSVGTYAIVSGPFALRASFTAGRSFAFNCSNSFVTSSSSRLARRCSAI